MKAKQTKNIPTRLSIWAVIVGSILLIPLLARFPWTTGDFIFAGVVLFGLATVYELVTKNMSNKTHRLAVGLGLMGVIVLIIGWAASGP